VINLVIETSACFENLKFVAVSDK